MALKWLRDNLRHLKFVLWGVVVVFVLLVFVDWGAGRAGGPGGSFALRIDDLEISEADFLRELQSTEQQMQSLYGDQWEQVRDQLDLPAQVVQRVISRELMSREARSVGLVVSDQELREFVIEQFSPDGQFIGQEQYERMLRSSQLRARDYEEMVRTDLLTGKLSQMVQYGTFVSDDEAESTLRRQRETADFDAIQVRIGRFVSEVTTTDEDVAAHYEEHVDDFHREEQRVLRYLVVETNSLRRSLPVEDAELEKYFELHRDEFIEGEKANARHILFQAPAENDTAAQAEVQLRAESVASMAKSGIDFSELAKVHSEDPGSKDNGGDLGWFGRGRMVEAFEDAVFSAKPGEVVGPIQSQFGLHIIKVEGFQPERQRPLDEVREQVRFRLLDGRAAAETEIRAQALADQINGVENDDDVWQGLADADDAVVLNESPRFSSGEFVPGLSEVEGLSDTLFAAEEGETGGPVGIPRGWVVWQLKKVYPEGVPPLEEIRSVVEQRVRRSLALTRAAEVADEYAAQWRTGTQVADLAAQGNTEVIEARNHRRGTALTGLGVSSAVENAVFSASQGDIVGPVEVDDQAVVIARIVGLQVLDSAEVDAQREQMRSRLMADQANQILGAILNERRRDAVIVLNPELMERFAPRS
ncbi:MAG: hypothetical protein GY906_28655 [bacterium]|nr:hypothetical protein [bacterium]